MSETDAQMEALAEAVVFAHDPETAAPPADDRQARAFERTAAIALASLAPRVEVPGSLQTRLAAAGLEFCAARSPRHVEARPRPMRRPAPVLAFACGVAAGAALYLLPGGRSQEATPSLAERAAVLAAQADAVRLPWQRGPSPRSGEVHGEVVWSPERQEGYLTFRGLPPIDPEHRFQLWIVDGTREGAPVDGGLFAIATADAETVVPVQAKLPIGKPAAFVVTVETKSGVVVSKQEHVVAIASL